MEPKWRISVVIMALAMTAQGAGAECLTTDIEVHGLLKIDVVRNDDGSASVTVSAPTEHKGRSIYQVFLGVRNNDGSLVSVELAARPVNSTWYADFLINSDLLSTSEVMVSYSTGEARPHVGDICASSTIE